MSIQALYTAATGMSSMETKLDVTANNLANVETVAFKSGRADFEDLMYRHYKMPGAEDTLGEFAPTGISVGLGSRASAVQTNFMQGPHLQTDRELDLAIAGRGFFQVTDPNGDIYYTRAGNFIKNANGSIVMGSASIGRLIQPPITLPPDAIRISISPEGVVKVQQQGTPTLSTVGQIELAYFTNPEGLVKLGENLYSETDSSGTATLGNPGQDGLGTVLQGALEGSNVSPVEELISLITTQRAFELNSKAVQVGDEMMQVIANLKRF